MIHIKNQFDTALEQNQEAASPRNIKQAQSRSDARALDAAGVN